MHEDEETADMSIQEDRGGQMMEKGEGKFKQQKEKQKSSW